MLSGEVVAGDLVLTRRDGGAINAGHVAGQDGGQGPAGPAGPAGVEPAGIVKAYAGAVIPAGYLKCDGSQVSRTTYAALFAAVGTAYGVGDGTTTFALPNLTDRFLRGAGATALGASAGNANITLTTAQLPAHNHPYQTASDDGWLPQFGAPKSINVGISAGSANQGAWSDRGGGGSQNYIDPPSSFIGNRGSGAAVNVLNPHVGMNYIITTGA